MIKKRVIPYFVLMAFPMGLGAGAANWLKLPRLPLPEIVLSESTIESQQPKHSDTISAAQSAESIGQLPDFAAIHPLVVGSFSLLLCTGILLAADKSKTV